MTEAIVTANDLCKTYDERAAINHLSVTIPAGAVTGVLGANGAGKSTFFRMIAGLIKPDSGHIEVLGEAPGWRTNAKIAYLPDRARWYNTYTVAESLAFADRLLPSFEREEADRSAEVMQLPLHRMVRSFSKGQEARLMLILCMCRSVPLIMLDEPFSGIDGASREAIIAGLIDRLASHRQTLLLSTHEIAEAEGLFDHVIILHEGQIHLAGDAELLRAQYGSIDRLTRTITREEAVH
ncbi:MAG: ABC transporter ATP-binding protein [Sporolactobacillus sp.]